MPYEVTIRFYEELNFFLPRKKRSESIRLVICIVARSIGGAAITRGSKLIFSVLVYIASKKY